MKQNRNGMCSWRAVHANDREGFLKHLYSDHTQDQENPSVALGIGIFLKKIQNQKTKTPKKQKQKQNPKTHKPRLGSHVKPGFRTTNLEDLRAFLAVGALKQMRNLDLPKPTPPSGSNMPHMFVSLPFGIISSSCERQENWSH